MKKVAFLHQTNPAGFGLAIRAVNKLKRMFSRLHTAHVLRIWLSAAILNGVVLS